MSSGLVYETTLNILREAGFVLRVVDESANVNGATIKTAFANYLSIDATDGTAVATTSDVSVTVNGVAVEVDAIDAAAGTITLETAPDDNATILVSYYYSPIALDYVEVVREDAQCAINSKMKKIDPCAPYTNENAPHCVRMMTRLWAGGLLLARDYGYNQDIELTSKDGYKKIEEAKKLLDEFYEEGGSCSSGGAEETETSGGTGAITVGCEGNMFTRPDCYGHQCGDQRFDIC